MGDTDSLTLLAALLAAFAFAGVVFALLYPYISGEKQTEKRVASVTESGGKKAAGSPRTAADVAAQRKKQVSESLKGMEARAKSQEKISLRTRLERAGLDTEPRSYWIASIICGLVCAGLALLWTSGGTAPIAAGAALLIGTLGLPRWVLSKMIARRQRKFQSALANAIDIIVRGVKSGLPLNECLQIIARESPEVIGIQQQAGGNLSEALGNLSGVLRDRLRMELKVKALSAEAKSSAAVLGSLPPGVMFMTYLSSPDYISPLFTTTVGNLFLLAGGFWMLCGILVMRKMINFKF